MSYNTSCHYLKVNDSCTYNAHCENVFTNSSTGIEISSQCVCDENWTGKGDFIFSDISDSCHIPEDFLHTIWVLYCISSLILVSTGQASRNILAKISPSSMSGMNRTQSAKISVAESIQTRSIFRKQPKYKPVIFKRTHHSEKDKNGDYYRHQAIMLELVYTLIHFVLNLFKVLYPNEHIGTSVGITMLWILTRTLNTISILTSFKSTSIRIFRGIISEDAQNKPSHDLEVILRVVPLLMTLECATTFGLNFSLLYATNVAQFNRIMQAIWLSAAGYTVFLQVAVVNRSSAKLLKAVAKVADYRKTASFASSGFGALDQAERESSNRFEQMKKQVYKSLISTRLQGLFYFTFSSLQAVPEIGKYSCITFPVVGILFTMVRLYHRWSRFLFKRKMQGSHARSNFDQSSRRRKGSSKAHHLTESDVSAFHSSVGSAFTRSSVGVTPKKHPQLDAGTR